MIFTTVVSTTRSVADLSLSTNMLSLTQNILFVAVFFDLGESLYSPPWATKQECHKPRPTFDPKTQFKNYDIHNGLGDAGPLEYMNCDFSHKNHWGQNAEDAVIYKRFFKDEHFMGNGFFLEMGGLDGWKFSNTFNFEHCLGWNGMLIEAQPDNYRKMIQHRPCTQNVWSAACPTGVGHIYMTRKEGVSSASSEMVGLGDMVPCRPLSAIFEEHHVTWIDFFSLDVEGHEGNVLETIDFSKVQIGVLIAEEERLGMDRGSSVASLKNQKVERILTVEAGMIKVGIHSCP
jgi:FkbM family methyltransferase